MLAVLFFPHCNTSPDSLVKMTGLPPSAAARMPPMSVNMPHFTLDRGRYTSNMTIEGWTITTTKRPILNGKEIDV